MPPHTETDASSLGSDTSEGKSVGSAAFRTGTVIFMTYFVCDDFISLH